MNVFMRVLRGMGRFARSWRGFLGIFIIVWSSGVVGICLGVLV